MKSTEPGAGVIDVHTERVTEPSFRCKRESAITTTGHRVDEALDGARYAHDVAEPHRFLVTWGRMGRFDFVVEEVDAWDPEEAMTAAAELHPELPRPRVALLASTAQPLPFGRRASRQRGNPGS